jgi:hypothetical protein
VASGGTILLTLTGPRNYDPAARNYDRAARARSRRVLVDEPREAHEQSSQLPEPHHDRLQATAQMLYEQLSLCRAASLAASTTWVLLARSPSGGAKTSFGHGPPAVAST